MKTIGIEICICKYAYVAARSKAWACGRSSFEIAGSNPAGGMGVRLF
jgi:hypothetical protein